MRQRRLGWSIALLAIMGTGCGDDPTSDPPVNDTEPTHPLSEPANWTYLGFPGGEYPDGASMPAAHRTAGISAALAVVPRDVNGNASPSGRIVLLSIGMSNTTQEFCNAQLGICIPGHLCRPGTHRSGGAA